MSSESAEPGIAVPAGSSGSPGSGNVAVLGDAAMAQRTGADATSGGQLPLDDTAMSVLAGEHQANTLHGVNSSVLDSKVGGDATAPASLQEPKQQHHGEAMPAQQAIQSAQQAIPLDGQQMRQLDKQQVLQMDLPEISHDHEGMDLEWEALLSRCMAFVQPNMLCLSTSLQLDAKSLNDMYLDSIVYC